MKVTSSRTAEDFPCLGWPAHSFDTLPSVERAVAMAMEVRTAVLGAALHAPLDDIATVCRAGRFDVSYARLGGARAGLEATLAPRSGNRFSIRVDDEPPGGWGSTPPAIRSAVSRHRQRFRICHEIAHSFFYDRTGVRPHRVAPASRDEEAFCDRFAGALLLPDAVVEQYPPNPESILECQERFDVSLQLAARAFAQVHSSAFIAVLVGGAARSPHLRLQWRCETSPHPPPPRWWTATWLQEALDPPVPLRAHRRRVRWGRGSLEARWRALEARRQVVLVARAAAA